MRIPIYQIDTFTNKVFAGNPAAVCPLERWLDDAQMQAIAAENNLSETAFFVAEGSHYRLRWFTPLTEVELCGHATLASAFVLFSHLDYAGSEIVFDTRSGQLKVRRDKDFLSMNFPSQPATPCACPEHLALGLGRQPEAVLCAEDYLAVLDSPADVLALRPDMECLKQLDRRAVIVTAPGDTEDFVSRVFGPKIGIEEDPVTGSSHCTLAPYWAARLGKNKLHARQVSRRGGELFCALAGDRVVIAGQAVTFLLGEIIL